LKTATVIAVFHSLAQHQQRQAGSATQSSSFRGSSFL